MNGVIQVLVAISLNFDPVAQFNQCVSAKGQDFIVARENFLSSETGMQTIQTRLDAQEWDERITAMILSGWKEHREYYESLVNSRQIYDRKGLKQFQWAKSPRFLKGSATPLMYELLLKRTQEGAEMAAAHALVALANKNTEIDCNVLISAVENRVQIDVESRRAAAFVLSHLPASSMDLSPERLVNAALNSPDTEIVGFLVGGVIRNRSKLEARDEVVATILGSPSLQKQLGRSQLIHAVGEIGGQHAAMTVVDFLKTAESNADRRWALSALSRSGTELGRSTVVKFAMAENEQNSIRLAAVRGLAEVDYNEVVGEVLMQIADNVERPELERIAAVQSMGSVIRKTESGKIRSDLDSRLEAIRDKTVAPAMKTEIQKVLRSASEVDSESM